MPRTPSRATAEQRQFAQQLRQDQTDCEGRLWQHLRNRQLAGCKFRRQFPCPPYVLDFYCAELKLAIELDGGQHFTDEALRRDAQRSEHLQTLGIRVIRFSNLEVLRQLPEVLGEVLRQLEGTTPHPGPLPKGARG
ncbi:endonuclease domain-containing protein [Aquipseudomonas ullengensis]|uniref:Endonuclease domain-containing protein n=1 Tax=Aquipseudomonas ullengensis TaxID=2759166 RepID=A0A7W4LLQ9_9GAMM|nr:endonuclease domain-containing protein [Pseudomonas ullengensis]MBB2495455.1 endonuclease domain-containing protein [Pseudomonas ullengensis]